MEIHMAAGEIQQAGDSTHGKAARPEGLNINDVHDRSSTKGTDDTRLPKIPLTAEDHETSKILADHFGARLKPEQRTVLKGLIENAMSGDLKDLGKLANPQNKSAEEAFAKMMDKFGYGVYSYPKDKQGAGSQFDSVEIVEKGANDGLRLKNYQNDSGSQNIYRFDATHNMDGSVRYDSDQKTIVALRQKLAQRLKDAVDRD
jgi:hypothetical protein